MQYREVQVKGILNHISGEDEWFGLSYNMNLYRGCEHQCIYCDTRSACYQIENFNEEVLVKINALPLLEDALPRKRKVGIIGFGSMNDPYTPAERVYRLTGQALELVRKYRFPVHIITKSDMVLEDLDTLVSINRVLARVSFTITTTDDALARKLEPGAPSPTKRLAAMQTLAEAGIETGVVMMPLLPFIEDTADNVRSIVTAASEHGARYVIPSFGVTVREGQREHFYARLDRDFPGVRGQYEAAFGESYFCPAREYQKLERIFYQTCEHYGLATRVSSYPPRADVEQLSLF
jgi:DNA repair photolyase